MDTLRDLDLVRAVPVQRRPMLLRADSTGGQMPMLEVRFSPFNVWYQVSSWWEGDFMERTQIGAFAKTMADARAAAVMPIKMLYDHGYDPGIGNKPLCPVEELSEETDSAVARGRLFDSPYVRELIPGLDAGVFGSSFRFRVIQDQWNDDPGVSDYNPKGLPERTITEVILFEQGPVTFPASPSASAGLRSRPITPGASVCDVQSMTDAYYERLRSREPARFDDLAARAAQIRTPRRKTAASGTVDGEGAAPQGTDEPADGHSDGYGPRRRRELIYLSPMGASQP